MGYSNEGVSLSSGSWELDVPLETTGWEEGGSTEVNASVLVWAQLWNSPSGGCRQRRRENLILGQLWQLLHRNAPQLPGLKSCPLTQSLMLVSSYAKYEEKPAFELKYLMHENAACLCYFFSWWQFEQESVFGSSFFCCLSWQDIVSVRKCSWVTSSHFIIANKWKLPEL